MAWFISYRFGLEQLILVFLFFSVSFVPRSLFAALLLLLSSSQNCNSVVGGLVNRKHALSRFQYACIFAILWPQGLFLHALK